MCFPREGPTWINSFTIEWCSGFVSCYFGESLEKLLRFSWGFSSDLPFFGDLKKRIENYRLEFFYFPSYLSFNGECLRAQSAFCVKVTFCYLTLCDELSAGKFKFSSVCCVSLVKSDINPLINVRNTVLIRGATY